MLAHLRRNASSPELAFPPEFADQMHCDLFDPNRLLAFLPEFAGSVPAS